MPLCPHRSGLSRAILAGAAVLALVLSGLFATPAAAQDAFSDFFGSLFAPRHAAPPARVRPRPVRRPAPRAVERTYAPERDSAPERTSAPRARAPAPAPVPQAPRPAASFFVAVIGDSLAGMLAQGLSETFADDPRVEILNRTKEDTGLVRDDFYDWRLAVRKLLDGPQHIDVAVIQIGINDNQKLHLGDVALEPMSKPFNEIYAKRIEEIAAAFRDKNVPLVWVGLPIMRSDALSSAALLFNDLDRQYGGALGARYVDLFEPFANIDSAYRATGPDVNGDIVRLRAGDGVHFNKAGARKAAHFVAPEIRHILQAALQPQVLPGEDAPSAALTPTLPASLTPPGQTPSEQTPSPQPPPPKPLAGKIQPLSEPAVSPGGSLAGLSASPAAPPDAAPTQPGRADDFNWPGK